MKIIIDIECNALVNPTQIWLIVCKDTETGEYHIFRNVTSNDKERERFSTFANGVSRWIGHHLLGYDWLVLMELLALPEPSKPGESHIDTLILSKLIDYPRDGHSIEDYGTEFGIEKGTFYKFTDPELYNCNSILFKDMEKYCIRDVDICHKVYLKYLRYLSNTMHYNSIVLEHQFQLIVNTLETNGFFFNRKGAEVLLSRVTKELKVLDTEILREFPPKLKMIREVHPKETKHGTLSRTDFRWVTSGDLSDFNGGPFCRCKWEPFNPSSHKQVVEVLEHAGWRPVDKTQTRIDTEREINRRKYTRGKPNELDLKSLYDKLEILKKTGWKINENNLVTLPETAPSAAKTLAKRILLESRRRTLTEWISLVKEDGRIHGDFYGIGAWTHRMAHQHPNTANIPTEAKLFGKEMRGLWCAPRNRLLVGVDAEGIQLRVFAHYIDDPEFTAALVKGKKDDLTDPHSLNQRILGAKSRNIAKRFIFAFLLGAGVGKLAQILEIPSDEAGHALARLLDRYEGLARLKDSIIPADAKRGWFVGIDGRRVAIPGQSTGERKHLCMSGYLQNGEAIIIKTTAIKAMEKLKQEKIKLVNIVHDEYVIEVPNNIELAEHTQKTFCETITEVGEQYQLKCPLAGDGAIGLTWSAIH